ncbi:hypothetical protein UFOVP218_99 [uncultured Caudovirales phage]|uniref:Uncharacterized protein n=1 Tax=uncultured Caudovirales phage TaxID=2100421 RepID=A0A6J7WPV5_9CAUD|nr:hypothetical protein UFOVP218_99 [uncultured Caudovirales phage]
MKKLLALLLLTASVSAMAQHGYGFRPHGYYGGGWGWVAPTVIGGVVGYEIARSQQPVVIQQQPIVIQQPQQLCSPWTETQQPDGTITRTRTCSQ